MDQKKYKFNIAILSSFTFSSIKEALLDKFKKIGVSPDFYMPGYNQYTQEILNEESQLYKFDPQLIIFFVDIKSLTGELFFSPYQITDEERKKWVEEKINAIKNQIEILLEKTSANIILHNFEIPAHSPLGILENKQEFGFAESIEKINDVLKNTYKNNNRVFVFDYNSFCSKIGKQNIFDPKMYYLGDIKISLKYLPDLGQEYMSFIKPMLSMSKKCIVLDLDNTLWGGVAGEDGIGGIKLGPFPEGRPFWEFQKHLLALHKRGVLFAINSKNNPEDALKIFREHPYMVLKEEHFSSIKINWQDKARNMQEIAKELNIGLDSMVFIDDDKINGELIKGMLPEVEVLELPEDKALYAKTFLDFNGFNVLSFTEEDAKRGKMYKEEKNREELKASFKNLDEFLKSLELEVSALPVNSTTIPRISQLTQKTNQFNLTTKRYLEKQIEEMSASGKYVVNCYQAKDKFGEYGIVGVAIIEKREEFWHIDTFLLSCRALAKNIETAMMADIIDSARGKNVKKISGEFIATEKNKPAEDFYKKCKFKEEKQQDKTIYYAFSVFEDQFAWPNNIKFIKA